MRVEAVVGGGGVSIFNPGEVEASCGRNGREGEETTQGNDIHLRRGKKSCLKSSLWKKPSMYSIRAAAQAL